MSCVTFKYSFVVKVLLDLIGKFNSTVIVNNSAIAIWVVNSVLVPSSSVPVDVIVFVVWDLALSVEPVIVKLFNLTFYGAPVCNHWIMDVTWAICHLVFHEIGIVETSTCFLIEFVKLF